MRRVASDRYGCGPFLFQLSPVNYENEIFNALQAAGPNGAAVKSIARYVYNACNSFFMPLEYGDVYRYVSAYLARNAKRPGAMIKSAGKRGRYRLNLSSPKARQLSLIFGNGGTEEPPREPSEDSSLSLF